ncbi:MAG TPA: glycine C-acetyltransferase [Steroidobacteraceae bacterium]|nr:glycine C-acetyltransferase [Steroidobacteraceae bacterium]
MYGKLPTELRGDLQQLRADGLYKQERQLESPQRAHIQVRSGEVINFCANNYLGLASEPQVLQAAHEALERWGYGMASVRFICGTQSIHVELEEAISSFLGTGSTILYNSCFDANGGLFETLLDEQDTVISDELNHASIIDGIRLCKAQRLRYRNGDMGELEQRLREAAPRSRRVLIATDGVFSMDGYIARLRDICDLAERHGALVMVDDSHAVGVLGARGRGTPEYHDVIDRVDILTGTLGKALGGACGGYTSGRREIIDWLRQRSRPYLFSNSLPPPIAAVTLKVLELLAGSGEHRRRLLDNTAWFRTQMSAQGFDILPGEHPIVPIMIGAAHGALQLAERLLEKGIYVVAFSYPVVPRERARIRVQISAAHSREDLALAVRKFAEARAELAS